MALHALTRVAVVVVVCAGILGACGDDGGGDDAPCTGAGCDVGPCVEAWQCSAWSTDGISDSATRTCTDQSMCGTTSGKPTETAMLPALDPEYYECNVEPVLVKNCAMMGCHGTETGRAYRIYARGRLRITGLQITEPGCLSAGTMGPSEDCIGNIECKCFTVPQFDVERRRSFDSARGFALDAMGNVLADKAQSELLAQPQVGGGFAHAGMAMWSAGDAEYTAVKTWLDGAVRGSACNSGN